MSSTTVGGLRLIVDTGALVLIWLVQLVIYPAYAYSAVEDFRRWHPVYTARVTLVVMPIMLGQVGVYALLLYLGIPDNGFLPLNAGTGGLANTCLIAAVWAVTFFRAVPLHAALDAEQLDHRGLAEEIVRVNWYRTALWTIAWCITVYGVLLNGDGS